MIDSIEFDENLVNREDIDGNGYSDKAIINKKIKRNYNIVLINQLIKKNKNIKVFSTWGKGPKLKNWTQEVAKIETQIINLCSPRLTLANCVQLINADKSISLGQSSIVIALKPSKRLIPSSDTRLEVFSIVNSTKFGNKSTNSIKFFFLKPDK